MNIDLKELIKRNYEVREIDDTTVLIKKVFKDDSNGKVKYTVRIIMDHEGFDIEAEYVGSMVSYLRLQTDDRTTIDEIEEFYERAYLAFSGHG